MENEKSQSYFNRLTVSRRREIIIIIIMKIGLVFNCPKRVRAWKEEESFVCEESTSL